MFRSYVNSLLFHGALFARSLFNALLLFIYLPHFICCQMGFFLYRLCFLFTFLLVFFNFYFFLLFPYSIFLSFEIFLFHSQFSERRYGVCTCGSVCECVWRSGLRLFKVVNNGLLCLELQEKLGSFSLPSLFFSSCYSHCCYVYEPALVLHLEV